MINSLVAVYLQVLRGFHKDVLASYPALPGIDLDVKRLTRYCQLRGQTTFLLDLPNLSTLLKSGLETGRLQLEGPLSTAVSKRVRVPRLFAGLWLRVFDKDACLKPDADVNAIMFLEQLTTFGKKITVKCSDNRRKAALENYHDIERTLRRPSLHWGADELVGQRSLSSISFSAADDSDRGVLSNHDQGQCELDLGRDERPPGVERLLSRLQQVADSLVGTLPFLEPVSYSMEIEAEGLKGVGFRHGPGAVAERMKNWVKSQFPYWPAKLEAWFPFDECGLTASQRGRPVINHELGSRLIFVKKTAKAPRIIAAEPVAHQWCQQLINRFLIEEVHNGLMGHFVDFRRQELSGRLVIKASLDRSLATVDLSDASDRLSCWTVERAFRSNPSLLACLHAARTRYLRDDITPGSDFLRLRKFASQGTATTFPVQTLVYLFMALAACVDDDWDGQDLSAIKRLRGKVRIYGDDIILPRYGYERLLLLMTELQLKVNVAKSYVHGHYRESCGTDGYKGYDITPCKPEVIVSTGPASCQAVIDASNNLFNKGFFNASQSLKATLPVRVSTRIRIVGPHEVGCTGFNSFSGSYERHLNRRWNSRLHRNEVQVWTQKVQIPKETRDGYVPLLDFFTSRTTQEFGTVVEARTCSTYGPDRKSSFGLQWEPSSQSSHANRPGEHEQRGHLRALLEVKRLPAVWHGDLLLNLQLLHRGYHGS